MKFKPSQEITPKKDKFVITFGAPIPEESMPKYGKVYTVHLYPFGDSPCHPKRKYMLLAEIPFALFNEDSFEVLVTSDKLEDDLMELFMLGERLADG